jgi:tyrosyl-tRNA synthetase
MGKAYKSTILKELNWRNRIEQMTHDSLDDALSEGPMAVYCGFDPSQPSLTAGNLMTLMGLAHFYRHGHPIIVLLGGATGQIGDPSFKSSERSLQDINTVNANLESNSSQIRQILERSFTLHRETRPDNPPGTITFVNNADWMSPWSYLDFLREVGKNFRVNNMMAKEAVKGRLETREQGISYSEFSYMLIQAYDFLHLHQNHRCNLQIGGSDQWGNITAGIDLVRRMHQETTFGLTFPLLLTAGGEKMGKSEKGALWLDPEKTSPYEWYQYWVQREDSETVNLLYAFTFLSKEEVGELTLSVSDGSNQGDVQKRLAYELTELVHGKEGAEKAILASKMLFGEPIENLSDRDLLDIFSDVPSKTLSRTVLEQPGISPVDLFETTSLASSKGEARRLLSQGGGYLNNRRLQIEDRITTNDLASENMLVLRAGKRKYHVVQFN